MRVLIVGFLLVASAVFTAGAATTVVNNNSANTSTICSSAKQNSLKAAVADAKADDTILVCPGSYPEQLTITKNLNISGIESNQGSSVSRLIVINPNAAPGDVIPGSGFQPIAVVSVIGATANFYNVVVDGTNTT